MVKLLLVCLAVCVAATSATSSKCSDLVKETLPKDTSLLSLSYFKDQTLSLLLASTQLNENEPNVTLRFPCKYEGILSRAGKGASHNITFKAVDIKELIVEMLDYQDPMIYYIINYLLSIGETKIVVTRTCNKDDSTTNDDRLAAWSIKGVLQPEIDVVRERLHSIDPTATVKVPGS